MIGLIRGVFILCYVILNGFFQGICKAPLATDVVAGLVEDSQAACNQGDYATAVQKLRPLAEQGNAGAQFILGRLHAHGTGVLRDGREAAKWYLKAAKQGNASAQFNLGWLYACPEDRDVVQDYMRAYMWFRIAKENGHETAQVCIDAVEKMITPAQIAKAEKLARKLSFWNPFIF